MKLPRSLAVLSAAVLLPIVFAAPAAHANESFSGTLDGTETADTFKIPNYATETCGPPEGLTAVLPTDRVAYASQSAGPRRFVVRSTVGSVVGIWVYRNGVCVAADVQPRDPGTDSATGVVDVNHVDFAVGDQVLVKIVGSLTPTEPDFHGPLPWTLTVEQAGTANAVATGKGAKYVGLGYQVGCVGGVTSATLSRKLVKHVDDVSSVTFTAGGEKLRKLSGAKLEKAARKAKKGKPVPLVGVPAGTTSLKAVVKFDNGKKAKVTRPYSTC